ncbi:MAG TPA: DUF4214 domain-containing protein [Iamia sp.]|jgi:hypothetical protein|nr:DUF4214 domain-containing protein [Iamia sp.]
MTPTVRPSHRGRPRAGTRARSLTALALALVGLASLAVSSPAGAADACADLGDDRAYFVCQSYRSFLDRTPAFAETDYWEGQLPARKTVMLAALARSTESRDLVIAAYYDTYGQTPVGPAGLAYWRGEVLEPNGFRRLEAGLLGSYVGMIDGFLSKAFGTVLGRSPSEAESSYWGTRVVATSRTLVAADLIYTLEARRKTVVWTYYDEQFVDVGAASRDYWAERLRMGLSYLDLRIALKTSVYPESSGVCSSFTPPVTASPGCET